MQVYRFRNHQPPPTHGVVTIGNFDGVHLGHQALIKRVVEDAREAGAHSALLTFDPHPQLVLHNREVPVITSLAQRLRLFEAQGLDEVYVVPFTVELAVTSAAEFVRTFLIERFRVRRIVIGYDFAFGHNREGTAAMLEELSQQEGFAFEVFPAVSQEGEIVSSTRIREALRAGNFKNAGALLGRPYSVLGQVIPGARRGHEFGFPTLNLIPEAPLALPHGVYAVRVKLGEAIHTGVANYGLRPTVGAERPILETHLFDFQTEAYGEMIEVIPVRFLRAEQTFASLQALREQIARDSGEARDFFASETPI